MRNINNLLRRNRRLLERLLDKQEITSKCHRLRLAETGFNFRYHTHQYVNKKGQIYKFCYDYGYLELESDWLLIVRYKEEYASN